MPAFLNPALSKRSSEGWFDALTNAWISATREFRKSSSVARNTILRPLPFPRKTALTTIDKTHKCSPLVVAIFSAFKTEWFCSYQVTREPPHLNLAQEFSPPSQGGRVDLVSNPSE